MKEDARVKFLTGQRQIKEQVTVCKQGKKGNFSVQIIWLRLDFEWTDEMLTCVRVCLNAHHKCVCVCVRT